ncbi:MAG: NUDIX domain-containing protein [Chitinophagales bacterium]
MGREGKSVGDGDRRLAEETLRSEEVFRGTLITVRREEVRLPDGRCARREIVGHAPAVAILPLDDQDRALLVRQYRKPLDQALWEVPAGKIDPGETPEECARRELAEEAGVEAAVWECLGPVATTPGFTDEIIHLYVARGLTKASGARADEDEFLEVEAVPFAEVLAMVESGALWDAKSVCLVLREAVRRR